MLRQNRKINRHNELLRLLILHPVEGREATEALGINGGPLTRNEEKALVQNIKERVNGTDHS